MGMSNEDMTLTDTPSKDKSGKLSDDQVFRLIKSLNKRFEGRTPTTTQTPPTPTPSQGVSTGAASICTTSISETRN